MQQYRKSRLPGPAVKMFDMERYIDPDQTVARDAHDEVTIVQRPEIEWAMIEFCRLGDA